MDSKRTPLKLDNALWWYNCRPHNLLNLVYLRLFLIINLVSFRLFECFFLLSVVKFTA